VNLLIFLILFPFLAALILYAIPDARLRRSFGYLAAVMIIAATIYLILANYAQEAQYFDVSSEQVKEAMLAVEALMAAYIIYQSVIHHKYHTLLIVIMQTCVLAYVEFGMPHQAQAANNMFVDRLSLIMAFIIGVIGSLICVYAFGYMRDFHEHHKETKDRRGLFFFVIYAFLGAMFGLVFANNILWVYFFWELTTICSFILIGYSGSREAVDNAFTALWMNLLGGFAFALAIYYLSSAGAALTIDGILAQGKGVVLLPAMLIGFAGLTKSAQMPFSQWLIGAMVAPTPVSALLHSSTMVKAGVYILVRFAPIYKDSVPGTLLSLIGGVTFLLASGIAISQSNAKKVLAYSTVANLGLIVACAGVGTYEAVWAAILLIIFHAFAKSLMFLVVGTVEHRISSRDIEDMEGLIMRMPRITVKMIIGIAGMFLAPFGMLISKWATLKAFIDSDPVLVGMVAFGSGMTVFFWSKWMGKIITVKRAHKTIEDRITLEEWVVLYALAVLTIAICLLFPVFSHYFVEPFVLEVYGKTAQLGQDNIMIMALMLGVILLMPLSLLYYKGERRHLLPYMGGRNAAGETGFQGTMGVQKELSLKNYYLEEFFGEEKLQGIGIPLCCLLAAAMLLYAKLNFPGVPV